MRSGSSLFCLLAIAAVFGLFAISAHRISALAAQVTRARGVFRLRDVTLPLGSWCAITIPEMRYPASTTRHPPRSVALVHIGVDLMGDTLSNAKPADLVRVTCPACGSRLRAPAQAAGRTCPCPRCRRRLVVPAADLPE